MMADNLATHDEDSREERQKMFGLNYKPSELLWCDAVRKHLRFPHVVYWDHMHCLTASGGIAQYIVNQMVLRFCSIIKIQIADWDAFHMALGGMPRLRKGFSRLA